MLHPIVLSKLNQNKSLSGIADYVPLGSTNKQCYEFLTKRITELKKEYNEQYELFNNSGNSSDLFKSIEIKKEISFLTSARDALMDKDPNAMFQYSTEKKQFEVPLIYKIMMPISSAACAYHGYKRNKSVSWALWWALCGSAAFPIAPIIAFAQGFGKERKD